MGTTLSVIGEDDHFRLFAVENDIDPELLRIYQQALEVAYQYVTRELGLIFPENQPLLVLVYPPSKYQGHLTIGKITALPEDNSLKPAYPDIPYRCGNLPVFEIQLYPVEEIELH